MLCYMADWTDVGRAASCGRDWAGVWAWTERARLGGECRNCNVFQRTEPFQRDKFRSKRSWCTASRTASRSSAACKQRMATLQRHSGRSYESPTRSPPILRTFLSRIITHSVDWRRER